MSKLRCFLYVPVEINFNDLKSGDIFSLQHEGESHNPAQGCLMLAKSKPNRKKGFSEVRGEIVLTKKDWEYESNK